MCIADENNSSLMISVETPGMEINKAVHQNGSEIDYLTIEALQI